MAYLLIAVGVFWSMVALAALGTVLAVRRLPQLSEMTLAGGESQRVSVIMTARDEEQHIESSIRSMLAQEKVALQVVAVDDRSTDATGEILQRVAREDDRVTVVHIEELPAGWLGKCHACYQGSEKATGDWLLFTDADTTLTHTDVLARSVGALNRDAADHISLWPKVSPDGPLACGAIFAWQACLSAYAPPILINNDIGKRALGIGAYNLVRASAYREIGGHERLRMEVVDDIKLAELLRHSGVRQRVYKGIDDLETSWGGSAREMVAVLEKNWFAAIGFRLWLAAAVVMALTSAWIIAVTGPLWDTQYGWFALAGLLAIILPSLADARAYRWPMYSALFAPLGHVVFVWAAVNSVYKTLRQGGIRWRDTFYSLSELRDAKAR
ncbi:MAG: glycosyltransferase family 2 protein [Pirellulales bacterium]|nr:glycosyltransferase family 2 protein [Pirellulales bacterium]